ncbi:MAG: 4-hydroxy-tetrahydrodipicolinate reductase [Bacteroidetes bacterium]|nr:MAG: 4-hydroxy-tetrahydrodipicolinate reductase [Bacteroidota bacterium]
MKIALFGYGKMGKEIEQIALQRRHEVVLKIDENNIHSITKDDLKKCDAAIEFSTPASAISNMTLCFRSGIPVVAGTTGWYDRLEKVKKLCEENNGCLFYASNFSIGVNVFFKINEQLARMMNAYPEYNVSMEEVHHVHKLDAPSGTAISLANQITGSFTKKRKWVNAKTEKREELEIISKRIDEVPGTHTVKYFSGIDDIEIMHKAHNRKGFAMGAVLAAEFIKGKKGIFGMNDLMSL